VVDPQVGEPAWHPDPTGRHQLRWWNGAAFTDQVADGGVVSTDLGATAATTPAPEPSRRRTGLVLAIGGAVVVAAGAAAWWFLLRDEGSGTGTFEGRAAPDELGVHDVQVGPGTALAVRVEPGDDLDAVVAFVVSDADADRLEELYHDLGLVEAEALDETFPAVAGDQLDRFEGSRAVLRTDVGFAGEDEELLLAVPFALDVQVVVGPFADDDDDDYTIAIEAFSIDTDEDDDGEDVLEAVAAGDDVPDRVQELAEQLLDQVE
jgi:hypothetical protein